MTFHKLWQKEQACAAIQTQFRQRSGVMAGCRGEIFGNDFARVASRRAPGDGASPDDSYREKSALSSITP